MVTLLALSVAGIIATALVRALTARLRREPVIHPLPSARGTLPRGTYG